jgi:hypothetical protein
MVDIHRATEDPPEFHVSAVGMLYATVCTILSDEEAAQRLNDVEPTNVTWPWTLVADPDAHPRGRAGPCAMAPDTHRHLLFEIRSTPTGELGP